MLGQNRGARPEVKSSVHVGTAQEVGYKARTMQTGPIGPHQGWGVQIGPAQMQALWEVEREAQDWSRDSGPMCDY